MTDISVTGVFDNEVHYLLNNYTYDGKNFYLLDLSAGKGVITGNKAWKLKHNLIYMLNNDIEGMLTFGGAYSNHIYQTARMGHRMDIPTIGLIRGEIDDIYNPTLNDVRSWGMQLVAMNRSDYRRRLETSFLESIQKKYPRYHIVPEGGTNTLAINGTTELGIIVDQICNQYGFKNIGISVATGGTMAGIIKGSIDKTIIGYGALKGKFITKDVERWLEEKGSNWVIEDEQSFGGYGKWNSDLIAFIKSFYQQTEIVLDPIYNGKMMWNAWKKNRLDNDTLFIHTGGIQGNRGYNQRFGLDLPIA